jgi:hypothetical protein
MNKSYGIGENASKLLPSILDASVFSSVDHCDKLLQARENFFVSDTLYTMLYREYDKIKVFDTLRYFVFPPPGYLPLEKLDLQSYLEPYKFKEEYVKEIYPYYEKSLLPSEVKQIILDEYSFLKEYSSVVSSK